MLKGVKAHGAAMWSLPSPASPHQLGGDPRSWGATQEPWEAAQEPGSAGAEASPPSGGGTKPTKRRHQACHTVAFPGQGNRAHRRPCSTRTSASPSLPLLLPLPLPPPPSPPLLPFSLSSAFPVASCRMAQTGFVREQALVCPYPITLRRDPTKGRHLVAARDLAPGEEVYCCWASAHSTFEAYHKRLCACCLQWGPRGTLPLCCRACNWAYYCSPQCQRLHHPLHTEVCAAHKTVTKADPKFGKGVAGALCHG